MVVIVSALIFLFGAPAVLLWMGKLIQRIGLERPPANSRAAGDAWYYRPVQPVFGDQDPAAGQEPPLATDGLQDQPWYSRPPSGPMFTRPSWLRRPTFAGHGTD